MSRDDLYVCGTTIRLSPIVGMQEQDVAISVRLEEMKAHRDRDGGMAGQSRPDKHTVKHVLEFRMTNHWKKVLKVSLHCSSVGQASIPISRRSSKVCMRLVRMSKYGETKDDNAPSQRGQRSDSVHPAPIPQPAGRDGRVSADAPDRAKRRADSVHPRPCALCAHEPGPRHTSSYPASVVRAVERPCCAIRHRAII